MALKYETARPADVKDIPLWQMCYQKSQFYLTDQLYY